MEQTDLNLNKERERLLTFLFRKRKIILSFSFVASALAFGLSYLITPLYLSTAIIFPAASSSVSFSEQRNTKASSMDFGEEEQAEQLVQILQSAQIKDLIVEKFDLMKHYNISESDGYKYDKLNKAYEGHFSFERTRFGSIKIDVLDRDPKLAARMANEIVSLIDTVKNNIIRKRTLPAFEITKRKKEQLENEINALLNEMDSLSKLGVVSLDVRSRLFQALVDSKNPQEKKLLQKKIEINSLLGSTFDGLERKRNEKITKLEDFKVAYEQAESDAATDFSHKFVVQRATVADKKDQPKRLIITIIAAIGSFIFIVFSLLLIDRYKELKLKS
ncbi:MAG: Wzz/FepE/Etk N-terminal domain-containing protein [Crocinitomicaceae bacterium]|jgi:tyrosine-protein kinase Etk/Wzc